MTESTSFDWIPQIDPALKDLDTIPLTHAPPFPWEELSANIARTFGCQHVDIQIDEIKWRAKIELFDTFGDILFPLTITIPAIKGEVFWLMPHQEISILASLLLTEEKEIIPLHDSSFIESFYRFLALEFLFHFSKISYGPTFTPILSDKNKLPEEDALCLDISLHIENHTLKGRLVVPNTFRKSWVEHFSEVQTNVSEDLKHLGSVRLHVEVGKTEMALSDWQNVQLGDFLILDHCSLDPNKMEGRVLLVMDGKAKFRAKIKEHTLKILETPNIHEV